MDTRIARSRLSVLVLVLGLGACATPYQQRSQLTGSGYSDEKLGEHVYRLTFLANPVTDRQTVLQMWHRRAGELCPGMGYEHDAIYSEKTRRDFTNIYTAMQEHRDPYVEGTVKCTPEAVNIVDLNRPSLPHPFPR